MRNIWIPLSLLLLLLFACTWKYGDSFGQPPHYTIIQKTDRYDLEGVLHSQEAINRLKTEFADYGAILDTKEAKTNALLEPRGSLMLVEKIIPAFVSHYHKGSIRYQDARLVLSGNVENEVQQRETESLLVQSSIPVKNRTMVVKLPEISFIITQQKRRHYVLEGDFSSTAQKNKLIALFQTQKCTLKAVSEEIDPQLKNKDKIIDKLEAFIPFFISRIYGGKIIYQRGKLSIGGKVMHKKEIERVETYLSKLGIETQNGLVLNIRAIKGKKAKRKAKKLLKALQKQRAKKEEVKKAQQEVSKDIVAMMDAKRGKESKSLSDNTKVRKNLRTLFETEIIKFNTAQTTLTPLGLGTVSKIAVILKAYPTVKIEIAGHTDSDGDDAFNMLLSQGRVNNVKRALMKEGITKERIKAVGYGETKPLLPNTNRKNKEKNRRVEIIVIGE